MHPSVHCGAVYDSQNMEATEMSIDRGMNKEDGVHIYNGILLNYSSFLIFKNGDNICTYLTEFVNGTLSIFDTRVNHLVTIIFINNNRIK